MHSSRTVSESLDTGAAVALPEYPLGLGQEGEKDEMEETPRGGREWLGSSGLGECSRELLLRCFFHLARRFWNQTWHTIIIYTPVIYSDKICSPWIHNENRYISRKTNESPCGKSF